MQPFYFASGIAGAILAALFCLILIEVRQAQAFKRIEASLSSIESRLAQ